MGQRKEGVPLSAPRFPQGIPHWQTFEMVQVAATLGKSWLSGQDSRLGPWEVRT